MRRLRTVISLILALAFICSTLLFAIPVSTAEYVPKNMSEIVGIDYNRITQKTYGGKKSFPVELKLGDVSFSGELYGDYGLTYEELNDIIYKTLADKNLTVDRIVLVGKIASQVGTDAAKYWGDQVIEGLLSYLPLPTAEGLGSVGDAYALAVHGDLEPGLKSSIFNASKASASEAISRAAKLGGKVGRVGSAAAKVAAVPLLGEIVNTAMVAVSWSSGSDRFKKYQELLEKNLAVINDFYSTCSQRAVKLVEDKDEQNIWKIKFDKRKNYRTYNCTFWSIQGNVMSCTLSGELVSQDNSLTGSYTGTLWLDLEAVDFSQVERNLDNTPPLRPMVSLATSGGYVKTSDTGGKTVLKCEAQGQLTFYVEKSEGTVKPNVVGSLSNDKEVTFSFNRHIIWQDEAWAGLGAHGRTEATFTSSSIDSVHMVSTSTAYSDKGGSSETVNGDETFSQDPGTVFSPLESDPVIIITFK